MEIVLTREAIWALNHLMGSITTQKTPALRAKNHVNRAFHAGPLERVVVKTEQGEGERAFSHPEKPLIITKEDAVKYVLEEIKNIIEKGVPGSLTIGYEALLDAFEAAVKTFEEAEAAGKAVKEVKEVKKE